MRELGLNLGYVALVDDDDYERVVALGSWFVSGGGRYAMCQKQCRKKKTSFYLHRFIMGVTDRHIHVDHKDHDGMNNTRANLRICTCSQNLQNQRKSRGTSQYKGVYWFRQYAKWKASIGVNGKSTHLGYFTDERLAAEAYDRAARRLYGEFCHCNFPVSC